MPTTQTVPQSFAPSRTRSATETKSRIDSIDAVRGIVMVLMALDHVRDYFGSTAVNPTDLSTTTVPLFFTRWITHFCAPTFFLLTGVGAYLSLARRGRQDLSRFLLMRGLWLIVLEAVVMRCLAWQFNFDFRVTILMILWALGWAMITLSLLVRWKPAVAAVFGLVLIFGHNLFDGISPTGFGLGATVWRLLHQQNLLVATNERFVILAYPLIPWVGVTAVGYALGQVYEWDSARRRAFLAHVGVAAIIGFALLRTPNAYGDPRPWSAVISGPLSFINTTKNPPSLLFLLMTLGPTLIALRSVDTNVPRWLRSVIVFGRVPLFYFVLHAVLIHALVVVVGFFRYGGEVRWAFTSSRPDQFPFAQPRSWPVSLPIVYAIWAGVVIALWPLCRWFAGVRARRRDWWLSYL